MLSLDFELLWGIRDRKSAVQGYRENLVGARRANGWPARRAAGSSETSRSQTACEGVPLVIATSRSIGAGPMGRRPVVVRRVDGVSN